VPKPLTRKQIGILERLCAGQAIHEIAEETGMSRTTVSSHLLRVKAKLRAETTFQAVAIFERKRIKEAI
jgi:DNA-binding NarL/FixJ family response regulator